MVKNRTFQLIYLTAFCALGILGIVASLGTFDYTFRTNFFCSFY